MIAVGALLRDSVSFLRTRRRLLLSWIILSFAVSLVTQALQLALGWQLPGPSFDRVHFWTVQLPVSMLGLIEFTILFTAVNRAILQPGRSGFAYLRFGMDELRTIGLVLLFFFGFLISIFVCGVVLGLLAAGLARIAGAIVGTIAVVLVIGFLLATPLAAIYGVVRLIPMIPLTMLNGRITIGRAWRLTRGYFWRLFGASLLIWLACVAISMGLFAAFAGSIVVDMFRVRDPFAQARVFAFLQAQAQMGWPLRLAMTLLSAIVTTPLFALQSSLSAVATQALIGIDKRDRPAGGPWS